MKLSEQQSCLAMTVCRIFDGIGASGEGVLMLPMRDGVSLGVTHWGRACDHTFVSRFSVSALMKTAEILAACEDSRDRLNEISERVLSGGTGGGLH